MRSRRTGFLWGSLLILMVAGGLPATAPAQSGAPSSRPDAAASEQSARERIDQAEAARREAAGRGAEWLETAGLIEEARREADQGNWREAEALAERALQQGNLAVAQAERESEAWRNRVVK
jgi:hypothetical protein